MSIKKCGGGGEIHIKFGTKYISLTTVGAARDTCVRGSVVVTPPGCVPSSTLTVDHWLLRVLIPARAVGFLTAFPWISVTVQRCVRVCTFFIRTIRYTFVPEGSLFGFVSILVAEVGTSPPQSIPPT
jgi:hypothetical protein